jgi:hypothetical protein
MRRPTHPQDSTKTACRIKGREVSITARQDKQHRAPATACAPAQEPGAWSGAEPDERRPRGSALVVLAEKGGIDVAATRRARPRVAEVPFDAYKLMATFVFYQVFNLLNLRNLGSTLLWAEDRSSGGARLGGRSAATPRPRGTGRYQDLQSVGARGSGT